jgi:hypothetical protein
MRRFAAHLLQSCICQIRLFGEKHTETEGIRGQTLARPLCEPDILEGWALNLAQPLEPDTGPQH